MLILVFCFLFRGPQPTTDKSMQIFILELQLAYSIIVSVVVSTTVVAVEWRYIVAPVR